ncbi:MAG: LPXTG cell wall anchor domain-containing protein, partial [Eubacterium sp.]
DRERRDYITVVPKEPLQEGKTYTLKIDSTLQAKSGSVMPESRTLTYTTLMTEKPFNMTPIYMIIGALMIIVIAVVIVKKNKKH